MHPNKALLLITLCFSLGCKQTYQPPTIANPPDYLVVEGFINTNPGDSTVFNLSRTVKLDTNLYAPETGATVTVEGSDNSSQKLNEIAIGTYRAILPGLNYSTSYRLHIVTASGILLHARASRPAALGDEVRVHVPTERALVYPADGSQA